MWFGHGCRQAAGAANRNVDPDGAGAGGQGRAPRTELISGLQEGCSSEEERGLACDFMEKLSLVLEKIDSCKRPQPNSPHSAPSSNSCCPSPPGPPTTASASLGLFSAGAQGCSLGTSCCRWESNTASASRKRREMSMSALQVSLYPKPR